MRKRLPFLLAFGLLFFAATKMFAQYNLPENKIWAFGNKTGMDFSSGNPLPITTNAYNGEGCTAIAAPEGGLMFYTNGNKVWDSAGNVFPHGQNLDISENEALTTTQPAVIIPVPGQLNKFYLFAHSTRLYVYLVDMSLNNGMGDIDITFPLTHVKLLDSLTEKLIAAPGCNNNVWLLTRGNFSDKYYAFNITTTGINTTPVISAAGVSTHDFYFATTMTVSPDGNKIAVNSLSRMEILNFDKTNGKVSMDKILDESNVYGSCFSPNGKLLYGNKGTIIQYNLLDCDPVATKVMLGGSFPGDIRLAVNGKIYFRAGFISIAGPNYLGSVEQPDITGTGCHFRDSITETLMPVVQPGLAMNNSLGLHNTVVKATNVVKSLNRSYFDTCICQFPFSTGLNLIATPGFQGYVWSDGSTATFTNVHQPGKYWVSYNTTCGQRFDTFTVRGSVEPVHLTFNDPVINTSGTYTSYKWYKDGIEISGANAANYQPTLSGIYSVVVANSEGCTDSAFITINKGATGIVNPALQEFSVYPNPVTDILYIESSNPFQGTVTDLSGRAIIYFGNEQKVNVSRLNSGVYFVKLMDKNGHLIMVKKLIKKAK
ncbi:T9SS type A sorting domain-containing protein [Taibaiella lutea]|uniref:T9SS type A sorting domain-containing protein n=1 Tax=Taibaiella lutea TaxID=2608001 RepID=A0A5M6CU32_9BACT|nr:T9SS type A sorting domain-containing protein [Taibaiella lutea]KAA5536515.1 T9SS type A sorting domain-containing protein [Taibaiella lutea]